MVTRPYSRTFSSTPRIAATARIATISNESVRMSHPVRAFVAATRGAPRP